MSAFSNTAGGTLVLGIQDRTRAVTGITDPLRVEEQIMNMAADGIRPQILPEVEFVTYRNATLVVVTVFPGASRPYYVQSVGRKDGSYVRVGSTNRRASAEILAELERTSRNVAFDEEPMPKLSRSDLDLKLARNHFAEGPKLGTKELISLNLLTRHGRRFVPTVGAVILFGHDRLQHFADARILLARFAGTNRATIVDRVELKCDLIQAIEETLSFLGRSTTVGMAIEGARRRDLPQYPPAALREVAINAVAHADYSQVGSPIRIAVFDDRIEVENPGLLPFGLTIEEVRLGVSKLRNRVIGRCFHALGLIEQWGSGIQRITQTCAEMGLPPPTLEEFGTCFRVTLHATKGQSAHQPTGTAGLIYELLTDGKSRSTASIAKAIGVTSRTTRTHLKRLVDDGLVVEIAQGPTDPRRVYILASTS
ncbi:MAG: putative HTH transcriptional regulator [Planctomycetota bacterium]